MKRESDISPLSSAEMYKAWNFISTTPMSFISVGLRHRDKFTFFLSSASFGYRCLGMATGMLWSCQ